MKFWNRKKKLPMGTKEQGGPETFKFNTAWNNIDKKFFISLISRKSYHTARLNLTTEEYAVILNRMVAVYEMQVQQNRNVDDV